MSTEKKVIAKLTVKTSLNTFTLLVFTHESGVVTYHLKAEISMANQSLDQLTLKSPLPDVAYDYATTKGLVNAVVDAVESSGQVRVVSHKTYFKDV